MTAVLAWLIIVVLGLAAFTYLVLTPLGFVVKKINEVVETSAARRQQKAARVGGNRAPRQRPPPSPVAVSDQQTRQIRIDPTGREVDVSFGLWGQTVIPYTTSISAMMSKFRPMIESNNEIGICEVAEQLLAILDEIDDEIPPPPILEMAVHWSTMISLLRQSCLSAIEGANITRNLHTASDLLALSTKEMGFLAAGMSAWTDKFLAGEL